MIKHIYKGDKGFTLIEIAIVLVIIGMMVAAGASMIGPLTKRMKYTETKQVIDAAVESVIGEGASNEAIPTTAAFPSVVRTFRDSWGKSLSYVPDPNLVTGGMGICGRRTTSTSVNICSDAGCTTPTTISNVAFLIASGGGNYNLQTGITSPINVYNPDIPGIDNNNADMNRAEPYDDVVKWVTLNEIRIKAGCVGPQQKILNSVLPVGNNGNPYSSEVFPEGGIPFAGGQYRWCIQTTTGTLPGWIATNPAATPVSTDCVGSVAEGSWRLRSTLALSGTALTGTTGLTVFVRDNNDSAGTNDNIVSKSFVITIN